MLRGPETMHHATGSVRRRETSNANEGQLRKRLNPENSCTNADCVEKSIIRHTPLFCYCTNIKTINTNKADANGNTMLQSYVPKLLIGTNSPTRYSRTAAVKKKRGKRLPFILFVYEAARGATRNLSILVETPGMSTR